MTETMMWWLKMEFIRFLGLGGLIIGHYESHCFDNCCHESMP